MSHSDEQCLKQKETKQQSRGAHFARNNNINFFNVGGPTQVTEPENTSFWYPRSVGGSLSTVRGIPLPWQLGRPSSCSGPSLGGTLQKQVADTMELFAAFGGSLYGATNTAMAKDSGNDIHRNSLTKIVDSGTTANYLDSELAPGLKHRMGGYKELEQPHKVITVGKHTLEGVATGTTKGTAIDKGGTQQGVGLAGILAPGLSGDICYLWLRQQARVPSQLPMPNRA